MPFGLNQRQQKMFYVLVFVITVPLLFMTMLGIRNESALILIFPLILGIPWSYGMAHLQSYFGHNSAGMVQDDQGNLTLSFLGSLLFLIPIYINIYIFSRFIYRKRK